MFPLAHQPRIIALTATTGVAKQDCLTSGMDEYMSKPVRLLELKNLLASCKRVGPVPRAPEQRARKKRKTSHASDASDPSAKPSK
jgi:CheY-like chemotaxis protein